MRVYISVDMEGIAGIATLDQVIRGGHGYPAAQALMTAETNAAIAGAFEGGATEVVVNDSHGTMDNLILEQLDPRASLILGSPKTQCMAEGLSSDFDVALFVGYHAPAGAPGVLAHTFSANFTEVRLDGRLASETSVNALVAGAAQVPVGLVTGDDVICALAAASLPGVHTVEVKKAHGFTAAHSLPPSLARDAVLAGAKLAVQRAGDLAPIPVPEISQLEIDMPNPTGAEFAAMMPGVVRVGDRTVRAELADPDEVVGVIVVAYELATAAVRPRSMLLARG